jgi:S1-C subfamily serine protease
MTGDVSPLQALARAIRETAGAAIGGVLQVRARGSRPATAAHVGPDLVVVALHALDRDEGLVLVRGDAMLDASLVGRDEALDIALLRVASLGPAPLTLADALPEPAQLVVAVTRTWQGDVSARLASVLGHACPARRWRAEPVPSLLRTDVPPSRGVSGGVIVDPAGRVQGWLTTGIGRGSVLAVPAAVLTDRVARLAAHGRIRRGYIGLAIQPVALPVAQQAHGRAGLLVSGLDGNGPAAAAGLFVGDVLMAADGQTLGDPGVLQALLVEGRIGTALPLQVLRGTTLHDIAITIGERSR